MKYQPNQIKVDIASYRHYWRGLKKIGKTTLFRDIIKEAYGDYKYGFDIAPGNESGFKALDQLYATEAQTWEKFVDIVDDLVENKSDNEFKLIAIDTIDELISIAEEKVLKVHQQRYNEKAVSLNAALKGFGAGQKMLQNLVNEQIKRLESAGYGLVFIGHCKVRDIKEKGMTEPYQQLTSNLESRFSDIFTDKADVIATFYEEKDVKENVLNATGNQRWIYFRGTNFVDAGSRFANMPERVPMTAKDYLNAFEQGVKSSFLVKASDKDIEKRRNEEVASREKNASEYIEKAKTGSVDDADVLKTVDDYKSLIERTLLELSPEAKKQKRLEFEEKHIPTKYKDINDIEMLKRILKVAKGE